MNIWIILLIAVIVTGVTEWLILLGKNRKP